MKSQTAFQLVQNYKDPFSHGMHTGHSKKLLIEDIAGKFWNRDSHSRVKLESPFGLFKKILACAKTQSFPLTPISVHRSSKEKHLQGTGASGPSMLPGLKRIWAEIRKKWYAHHHPNPPQPGIKYVLAHFPSFENHFPERGIPVGQGEGLHWIRPIRIEFKDFSSDGITPGDELVCTFSIHFKHDLRGLVGYMDRIKTDKDFSRWHIYPCGDIISSDIYRDHRLKHDLFRTLMGSILLGEIHPDTYDELNMDW